MVWYDLVVDLMQVIINYKQLLFYNMFTIFKEAKCVWIVF